MPPATSTPSRHEDFLSYAVPTIRGELKKHFRDQGWMVRPPRRVQEAQARITRAEGALSQELGGRSGPRSSPSTSTWSVDDVIEALAADGCFSPSSLDRPVAANGDAGGVALVDFLGEADQAAPAAEARVVLGPVVRQLKERDRRIVYMRFFEQRSQQEIADEIGVTQMQVSRLLARILRDLRTGAHLEQLDFGLAGVLTLSPGPRRADFGLRAACRIMCRRTSSSLTPPSGRAGTRRRE